LHRDVGHDVQLVLDLRRGHIPERRVHGHGEHDVCELRGQLQRMHGRKRVHELRERLLRQRRHMHGVFGVWQRQVPERRVYGDRGHDVLHLLDLRRGHVSKRRLHGDREHTMRELRDELHRVHERDRVYQLHERFLRQQRHVRRMLDLRSRSVPERGVHGHGEHDVCELRGQLHRVHRRKRVHELHERLLRQQRHVRRVLDLRGGSLPKRRVYGHGEHDVLHLLDLRRGYVSKCRVHGDREHAMRELRDELHRVHERDRVYQLHERLLRQQRHVHRVLDLRRGHVPERGVHGHGEHDLHELRCPLRRVHERYDLHHVRSGLLVREWCVHVSNLRQRHRRRSDGIGQHEHQHR
jgi:hypothetical protein